MRKQDLERAYKAFKGDKEDEKEEPQHIIAFLYAIILWGLGLFGVLIYKSLELFKLV